MLDINALLAWENGELDLDDTVTLFAELISSGLAWSLQGVYDRAAAALIDAGHLSREGEILG